MALDKEIRVKELNASGSSAVKSIDPYGRHNFFAEQMKEVNGSMDGEMFSKLKKPKYDEEQLILALDTDVDELIPQAPDDLPDVVLRSEYDALQALLDEANETIASLNQTLSQLRAKISDLESQIAGLKSELDASLIRVAVAENSAEAASDKFAQTALDLQQAIQKSIAEAIERVSLEAQVEGLVAQKEALVAQVGTLEEQLKGKTAELASGGDQSASGKWTYRVEPIEDASKPAFYYKTAEKNRSYTPGLVNGKEIIILNATEDSITYNITYPSLDGKSGILQGPTSKTIGAGESASISVTFNESKMFGKGSLNPYIKSKTFGINNWSSKAKTHNGDIIIKGGGDEVSIGVQIYKEKNGK